MDTLQKTWKQFADLFAGMSASQRMTLLAMPLLVLGGLAVLVYNNREPARDYLLGGKTFSAEELKNAQEALRRAGLIDFQAEGQRIKVPKMAVTQYNAALVEHDAMPAQYGDELVKMYREAGIWATDSDRRHLMEVGKSQELAKILRAISDVENARVSWERTKRKSFTGEMKTKALVSILPKSGRELSPRLVQSIRLSVAGALADLSPDDVVVLDERTGQAYQANSKDDPLSSEFVDQIRRFTEHYRKTIGEALSFIPEVTISVNVDLENLKSSYLQERELGGKAFAVRSVEQADKSTSNERRTAREPGMQANTPRNLQANTPPDVAQTSEQTRNTLDSIPSTAKIREQTFFGLLPKTVQVAVQIPRDFYKQVALRQGESEANKDLFTAKLAQIEQETEAEVQKIVARLVPSGSTPDAVNVSSYTSIESPVAPPTTPYLEIAVDFASRWGGPVAMGLFALWALVMLNRSLKTLPQEPVTPPPPVEKKKSAGALDDDDEEAEAKPATKRDQLQSLVRDNPEMAASVLSKWLTPTK